MNDLERDLRDLFHEDAARVGADDRPPKDLRRRAHRRQAFSGAVATGIVVALVLGAIGLVTWLMPSRSRTIAGEATTTATMNGITITYPPRWGLVDPDAAGLNGATGSPPSMPRLVLVLAPSATTESLGCPGRTGDPFLMTVQEEPLANGGEAAQPWPVDLERLMVSTAEAACYPGWTFEHAAWTAAGRTFEARIGVSPDISDADRDGLTAAFASMTFAPVEGGANSVVLATWQADGGTWQLLASEDRSGGLGLELQGPRSATGTGGFDPGAGLQFVDHVISMGGDRQRIIFGAVPPHVEAVKVLDPASGDNVGEAAIMLPDGFDPSWRPFFVTIDASLSVEVRAVDADGSVVSTDRVPPSGAPSGPSGSTESDGALLEDGRHFGFITAVDVPDGAIMFDLASWLSGEEANAAYQAAGGSGPVPNDHFVVNDNPRLRMLTLSPDLRLRLLDRNRCCDTFVDPGLDVFAQAVASGSEITVDGSRIRGQSQWWITVKDGVVTEIEEQYSP